MGCSTSKSPDSHNANNSAGSSKHLQSTSDGLKTASSQAVTVIEIPQESSQAVITGENSPLSTNYTALDEPQPNSVVVSCREDEHITASLSKSSCKTSLSNEIELTTRPSGDSTLNDPRSEIEHSSETNHTAHTTKVVGDDVSETANNQGEIISESEIQQEPEKVMASLTDIEDPVRTAMDEQEQFNAALRLSCGLIYPKSVLDYASPSVRCLQLNRALPPSLNLMVLLEKLPHLQEVDISGNSLGPQGFRAIVLSLMNNMTIISLNIANNSTDTDSAACLGEMLSSNTCLESLDVSGNYLGKDFFSRCVGPALAKNSSLKILRCESIGSTDMSALMAGAKTNSTLLELNLSHNDLADSASFTQNLADMLKSLDCCLSILALKNCGLKSGDMDILSSSLGCNSSLRQLTVSGNEVSCPFGLKIFLMACAEHSALTRLVADDMKLTNNNASNNLGKHMDNPSSLQVLSLANCQLTEEFLTSLVDCLGEGRLSQLVQVTLTNNPSLSSKAMQTISTLVSDKGKNCLEKISLGLNPIEEIVSNLSSSGLCSGLTYLNFRKAKVSAASLSGLSSIIKTLTTLETLVLDGIKLAGTSVLNNLLEGTGKDCSLVALSIAGCSLADKDLVPLTAALGRSLPLHMLKLAANRIADTGVEGLTDALLSQPSQPISLIDLSKNKISSRGARKLAELFTVQKIKMHSLNLSNNSIESDGLTALVQFVGCTSLTSLNVSGQQTPYEESDMNEIFQSLALGLGLKVTLCDNQISPSNVDLPKNVPTGLSVKTNSLGGYPGEMGQHLDSIAIPTDFSAKRLPHLSFQNALELAAVFKGTFTGFMASQKDWDFIIGTGNEAPSWLQLPSQRCLAIYMSHLPASVTVPKMEGLLEMEADCSVQEIVLMKDPLTRQNNGLAWALLTDQQSVCKAVNHYHTGQAQVFGQPFIICAVQAEIDDQASSKAEANARMDMDRRRQERKQEDMKHRALIQQSYLESQARHAYRLAHPAYADGRIW